LHIPKHQPRTPVYAHGKAWQRLKDVLVEMRPERHAAILREPIARSDWSAEVVVGATLNDLDAAAMEKAREKFKERKTKEPWYSDIDRWDWPTFLDKAKLTVNGGITRTALLLVGNPTRAAHHLSPHPTQFTWKLDAGEQAYEHFGPPFILTTTELLQRIRNVPQKLFPNNQLLPVSIQKYETLAILEAMHNCIAHQDYERHERILVTETADRLIFENAGAFFEGKAEDYFKGTRTPRRYRNPWLAHAMAEVSMIDTLGYGIHEITESQRKRFLPLPDYRRSTDTHTVLEVLGRPIDEKYSQLLLERRDMDIDTVILLDRVQKHLPISDVAATKLRREGLIEGRKPNLHVSASIAAATETEASYTRAKGATRDQITHFVVEHIKEFDGSTRGKLEELVFPLLPIALTDKQKSDRVKNLLSEMRRKGLIWPDRAGPGAIWQLGDGTPTSKTSRD
jgi:ATP-dependent DNA helicase RecG